MIDPNPLLQVYVAEKASANLVIPAHRHPQSLPQRRVGNKPTVEVPVRF
jgi:hypothetical protein